MSASTKILAGTAVGAGVVAGIAYIMNIKRAQASLEVKPQAYIHKLDWNGLTIRVDALLKNPTRASFKIKFPYIRIDHKDTLLGSSQVINKDIRIPAFGEAFIKDIMIVIPVLSFFSVIYELIKALMAKQPISLFVTTVTTIDLGWTNLPFNDKKEVVIKR
ncbi:hypothetical protein CAP35_07705 [Chitinophagaceae bacterium IBVUCB1]|nr:hypothetical protein CAP35_07705 [Chitinophagaceae bacterium IBVUCB1]